MLNIFISDKYKKFINNYVIYEDSKVIHISKIDIKKDYEKSSIKDSLLEDITKYGEFNEKTIVLLPNSILKGYDDTICKKFGFSFNNDDNFNYNIVKYHTSYKKNKYLISENLTNNVNNNLDLLQDFVRFAKKFLKINDNINIILTNERGDDIKTTAYYDVINKVIKVYIKNRAVVDICRSIGHELVHHKQNIDGRLTNIEENGSDGSEIENEANSLAGVLIRKFGKKTPSVYIN